MLPLQVFRGSVLFYVAVQSIAGELVVQVGSITSLRVNFVCDPNCFDKVIAVEIELC